jgi:hypothetical protein
MHRLALVMAFILGTAGYAFAQAPAADPHHPAQGAVQSGHPAQGKPGSDSATGGPQPQGTMQGMMQMM